MGQELGVYTESESQGCVTDPGKRGWRHGYHLGKLSWPFSDLGVGGALMRALEVRSPLLPLWVLSPLHLLSTWVVRNPAPAPLLVFPTEIPARVATVSATMLLTTIPLQCTDLALGGQVGKQIESWSPQPFLDSLWWSLLC